MAIKDDRARVRERFPDACAEYSHLLRGRWVIRPAPGDARWIASSPLKATAWRQAAHFAHATYTAN